MQRTFIGYLPQCIGQQVMVAGFVERVRNLKTMQFIVLYDETGQVQAASSDRVDVTPGSAMRIVGTVMENASVKLGGIEVVPSEIIVETLAETPLPLTPNSGPDLRLDWRFLDLRSPRNLLIFKVQTAVEAAMREFWTSEGFIEMHSPKFMGGASESGAELFRVEYFDRYAYLAQSPQFYKQMAMAAGFGKVFEIGPVFRANPSFTVRHDTEFTSVDVEISWIESHEDVMRFEERCLKHALGSVREKFGEEIRKVFGVEVIVPDLPFPRVTMAEAYEILERMGHIVARGDKGDLDPEGERLICRHFLQEVGHEFIFVTDYPTGVRPFYHMRHASDPAVTKSFDLLWKGLEITTGAQREHRYEVLIAQAQEKGVPPESVRYYLDFFRYGCPPHGGYGMGLTRVLMTLLGLPNVREATYLYRGVNRLTP